MVSIKHPVIAREGWSLLTGLAILIALLILFGGYIFSLPLIAVLLLLLFLFRDPERCIPALPLGIVSPVDGHVFAVEETVDGFMQRQAIRIRLRMNPLGVFSIRSPIEGKIVRHWHRSMDIGTATKTVAHCVQTDEADDVVWGIVSRRWFSPRCYVQPGERIGQGQRCGYALFGGVVDVYVPENSRVDIRLGQRVVAGEDVIASLVHQNGVSSIRHDET